MAGTYKDIEELISKSEDIFGLDIGVLVESLLTLGVDIDAPRVCMDPNSVISVTDAERWILVNVGLPQYVAPHLSIQMKYQPEERILIIAEIQENNEILLLGDGRVVWQRENTISELNSSCLAFMKTIALYANVVNQAMLIFGAHVLTENEMPAFLQTSFIASIRSFDSGAGDAWSLLTKPHWTQD